MKKYAFLAKLEELLAALPEQEREDALTYYEEYLDAAGKEREAETIAALGTPEEVAGKILEGEGLAAPAPAQPAAPNPPAPSHLGAPPAPEPGRPVPPPPAGRPEPPTPKAEPPRSPTDHPTPPSPPAREPGGPTPPPPPPTPGETPAPSRPGAEPPGPPGPPVGHPAPPRPGTPPAPEPGKPVPPPPGTHREPPIPGTQPPTPPAPGERPAPPRPGGEPPKPGKSGQAWKIVAVIAAAVVALALIVMAFDYAEDRAEDCPGPAASASVQQSSAFGQPAQSAAAQPQVPTQAPAAQPNTAANQDGAQVIGGDTTYAVNQSDGTATVSTAATGLELSVQVGDITLLRDDTVTQLTVEIAGAGQGAFDVKREKNELQLTDLRRSGGGQDTAPVTVTVRAPATVKEVDIKVDTGNVLLEGTLPLETSVKAGTGDVTAESIAVQELEADTGSGRITLARVEGQGRAVSLDLESVSGDIAVTVVGTESDYRQELETGSGSITVNGTPRANGEYNRRAVNELDAKSGSGSVTLDFIAQ